MIYTRETAIDRLLDSYTAYYNVNMFNGEHGMITARCDFFEHSQKYVLVQKAELWSSDCEEFLYIIDIPHLTKELFEQYRDIVLEDGKSRMNIGPGHMYTFITPVFIVDEADEDAIKALKKCRIYQSFHFSLHGWLDYRAALYVIKGDKLYSNYSGRSVVKVMKKVLYSKKRKERL